MLVVSDKENDLKSEYELEDNLTIAKTEKQLWDLLRMKISLALPKLEIDENEATHHYIPYFNQKIKYLKFADENIEWMLHKSFQKVIRIFPGLEELQLNWFWDEDDESYTQYDLLFEYIIRSKLRKFELNPSTKMRGFSIFSKEWMIYVFNGVRNNIQRFKAKNVNFHYDCNQWSTLIKEKSGLSQKISTAQQKSGLSN